MKRILQVAGFVAIFFLGNLVVNFYLFQSLSKLFDLPINGNFYLLIVLSALFYPVAAVLERILSDWVSAYFMLWLHHGWGFPSFYCGGL